MLSSNGLVNVKLAFIKSYFTSGTLTVYDYCTPLRGLALKLGIYQRVSYSQSVRRLGGYGESPSKNIDNRPQHQIL